MVDLIKTEKTEHQSISDEYGHRQEVLEDADELERSLMDAACTNCGTIDASICGCFGI